jgi:phasin family protein
MANLTVEKIAKTNAEALTKSGQAAEKLMKGNADAMTETGNASTVAVALTDSGNASRAAIQELTTAYQKLATKNVKNLTAAIQALSSAKNPSQFMELQQKLIKDGVEAAVSECRHIAQLTTAVFTAAFEPVKKQIEALQKTAQT